LAATPTRNEILAVRAEQPAEARQQTSPHDRDLKPFSEEWWAREHEIDARLRAKINICRSC
jgi:hypothetical protein